MRGAALTEVLGGADPLSIVGKAKLFRDHQSESALWNSAVLCCFPSYGMSLKELWQLVNAATGFDYATARAQDTLPARNLSQPLQGSGPAKGHVVELDPMLDEYFALMGWDQNGAPTSQRVQELAMGELLRVSS